MCRNSHDSSCTVTHHYIVGYIYRYLLACNGINSGKTFDLHACLILYKLSSLELALFCALCLIVVKSLYICDRIAVFLNDRVLRSNYHKGYAIESIRTCGIDPELFVLFLDLEVNKRTC